MIFSKNMLPTVFQLLEQECAISAMCVTKIRMALSWKWNGTEFWWLYRFSRAKVGVCIFGFCGNISVVVFWIKWQKSFGQTKIVLTFLFLLIFWIASWIFGSLLDFFLKVTQLQHPKGAKDRVKSLNFICSYFHLLSIDLSNHSLLHPAFSHLAQIGLLLLLHLHNLNA